MPTKQDSAEDLARAHAVGIALGLELADARAQRDLLRTTLSNLVRAMTVGHYAATFDQMSAMEQAREALTGVSDRRH